MLPARYFGETEFWMAIVKVTVLSGLILLCFIISMGGSPKGDRIGFRYWNEPGAFAKYLLPGSTGTLLGFWACICQAAFMFMGTEVVGVTFGEAKNPRKTIPRAIKQTIARIAFFYIVGAVVLGMCVPYTDPLLLGANKAKTSAGKYIPGVDDRLVLIFLQLLLLLSLPSDLLAYTLCLVLSTVVCLCLPLASQIRVRCLGHSTQTYPTDRCHRHLHCFSCPLCSS
jgi:amino acid transporter